MKRIVCENYKGEQLTFTYDFPFFLEKTDGLYQKKGTVTTVSNAFGVGEAYSGTSINKRNIVLSGIIDGDFQKLRKSLYDSFPFKTEGTLYYYEDDKDVGKKITYEVEDVVIPEKGIPRRFSISLICPDPYFKDVEPNIDSMETWEPAFEFPMVCEEDEGLEFAIKNVTVMATIENDTNLEFGITAHLFANGAVKNPYIINVQTQEKISINIDMASGDEIIINTQRGNKKIMHKSFSTGETKNINYLMDYGSKFLQMHSGPNTLRVGAEEGEEELSTNIVYYNEYEAV